MWGVLRFVRKRRPPSNSQSVCLAISRPIILGLQACRSRLHLPAHVLVCRTHCVLPCVSVVFAVAGQIYVEAYLILRSHAGINTKNIHSRVHEGATFTLHSPGTTIACHPVNNRSIRLFIEGVGYARDGCSVNQNKPSTENGRFSSFSLG